MKTSSKVLLGVGAVGAGAAIIFGLKKASENSGPVSAAPGTAPGAPPAAKPTPAAVNAAQGAATAVASVLENAVGIAQGAVGITPQGTVVAPGPSSPSVPGPLGEAKPMTDILNPAPPDVNNKAPMGSSIVGDKTSDGVSAETNRILNLQQRWHRLEVSGFPQGATDDMLIKYTAWKAFGVTRALRTMAGWENQFQNLIKVEDAWKKTHPNFTIDRRDVTAGT